MAASCSPSGRGYLLGVARLVVAGAAGQRNADPNMCVYIYLNRCGSKNESW